MNKRCLALVAVAASFLGSAQMVWADAHDHTGSWYVSPMATVVVEDDDRLSDMGFGVQLGLGYKVSPKWSVEGTLMGNQYDADGTTSDSEWEFFTWGFGVDFIRMLDANFGKLKPYGVFGASYLTSEVNDGFVSGDTDALEDFTGFGAHVGLGAAYPVSDHFYLRSDVRYRRDFGPENANLDDWVFNIGFAMPLGEPKHAAKPKPVVTDTDGDGVLDGADKCPNSAPGAMVDAMGCVKKVVAPKDSDKDGVIDTADRCPNTPMGVKVDASGCEIDTDKDGVLNRNDRCPNTVKNARVDIYGCEIKAKISLPGVTFETASDKLTADSLAVLDAAAKTLKKNPDLKVEAAGHTDSRGNSDFNLRLSQKRAASVRTYLISKGVNANMITARGYGQTEPRASNDTADGRRSNRRVALKILN